MATVASAFVELVPSARGWGRQVESQIGGDVDSVGRNSGRRLGGAMSAGIAAPLAAGLAALGVGSFFADAIGEARESQKVGALTANVIKVTGGAAKVTAGQVGDLATAISNKTGVDDEAIQSGANLLLTFKNVKNEVGAGANVFDRATAAAVDLSAAGFGDVAGSSKMLGKALNDPIAGITALGRAGVTFSAGQKTQIKGMVEAGNLLGAQKIIMAEVESQVGGAAAASATAGEKAAVAFGNLKEQIGTAMLPVIDKVASVFSTKVVPAISSFITGMQTGTGAGGAFVGFFRNLWAAIQPLGTFLMGTVVPAVQGLFASFQSGGGPSAITASFGGLVTFFRGQVVPAFMSIVTAVRSYITVVLPIVVAFVTGMMARIVPMLPTIRSIFAQIGAVIVSVMGLVQAVIQRVTTVISFIWSRWGAQIMNFAAAVFGKILVVIQSALGIIQGVIRTVTAVIKGDWSGAWAGIRLIVSSAWNLIKAVISTALTVIKGLLSGAWALIRLAAAAGWANVKAAISTAWDNIKSAVTTKVSDLVVFVGGMPGKILNALGNLASLLTGKGNDLINGLKTAISTKFGEVTTFVGGIPGKILSGVGDLGSILYEKGRSIVQGLINGLRSMIPDVGGAMSALAAKAAEYLPGSPVKTGPLRVLNRGQAGKQIASMLAGGIDSQRSAMSASMASLVQVPQVGSLDFASPAARAGAVNDAAGSGRTIVLQVSGRELTRVVLDGMDNEISGGLTRVGVS